MSATTRKVESGILASVYKAAAGLNKAGLVDKATMPCASSMPCA
jgi:hypothetical protein